MTQRLVLRLHLALGDLAQQRLPQAGHRHQVLASQGGQDREQLVVVLC